MQLLPWTAEREAVLIKMWLEGYSGTNIACELGGTTRNAVVGKAYRMMLKSDNHAKTWTGPRKPPVSGEAYAERVQEARRKARERQRHYRARVAADLTELPETFEHATMLIDCWDFERHWRDGRKFCRWPIGEPSATMVVCGALTVDGCVYCARHFRMAYVPTRERSEAERTWFAQKVSKSGRHLGLVYDQVLTELGG